MSVIEKLEWLWPQRRPEQPQLTGPEALYQEIKKLFPRDRNYIYQSSTLPGILREATKPDPNKLGLNPRLVNLLELGEGPINLSWRTAASIKSGTCLSSLVLSSIGATDDRSVYFRFGNRLKLDGIEVRQIDRPALKVAEPGLLGEQTTIPLFEAIHLDLSSARDEWIDQVRIVKSNYIQELAEKVDPDAPQRVDELMAEVARILYLSTPKPLVIIGEGPDYRSSDSEKKIVHLYTNAPVNEALVTRMSLPKGQPWSQKNYTSEASGRLVTGIYTIQFPGFSIALSSLTNISLETLAERDFTSFLAGQRDPLKHQEPLLLLQPDNFPRGPIFQAPTA